MTHLPQCSEHPDTLPYIKTIDVPAPHIAAGKCGECDRHLKWLGRSQVLELLDRYTFDDDIDSVRSRLATEQSPQTTYEWRQHAVKLWMEAQRKGYKRGWVWHQLNNKQAPNEAFDELDRLKAGRIV